MQGDYEIGGRWGNHVSLWDKDKFSNTDLDTQLVRVYGHKSIRPHKGQTLIGEFRKSFIKFEFVKVDLCAEPQDMFFADVKAIDQIIKETP